LDPNFAAADAGLVDVDVSEGKLRSAREVLKNVLNRQPHNIPALMKLGEVQIREGRPEDAVPNYEKAIENDPNSVAALNNLAFILADRRINLDRALQLAQKAKELSPDNTSVDDTIGWAYYNKGLYQTAVDYLSKAATNGTPLRKCHLAMAYV